MSEKAKVKFGIMGDLHTQMAPYTEKYVANFLEDCRKADVDFVIHLGDFVYPKGETVLCTDEHYAINHEILRMYNAFEKPSYHVIGNHDCDSCTKEEILSYWKSKNGAYYSFDACGYHFIVLDPNFLRIDGKDVPYGNANYFALNDGSNMPYLSDEQVNWLKEDLAKTPYPSILFSHQRLVGELDAEDEGFMGVRNVFEVKDIIDHAPNKVLLCINGHEHMDYAKKIDGVWYYAVNSVTMQWLGEEFETLNRFTPEIDDEYLCVKWSQPYSDGVYAIITIDEDGASVQGKQAEFVGPTPEELGVYEKSEFYKDLLKFGIKITPSVDDRYMPFK